MAYPFTNDTDSIVEGYTAFYARNFTLMASTNQTVYVPPPSELFRFFQTYTITKDIQDNTKVNRLISVQVPTVEISTIFLGIFGLLFILVVSGILDYAIFLRRYGPYYKSTPDTKLDWILQSVKEASLTSPTAPGDDMCRMSIGSLLSNLPKTEMRQEFESATFGSGNAGTHPTDVDRHVRRGSSKTYADFVGLAPIQTGPPPQCDQRPDDNDDCYGLLDKGSGINITNQPYDIASPSSLGSSSFSSPPIQEPRRASSGPYGYFTNAGFRHESESEGRTGRYQRLDGTLGRGPGRDYDVGPRY
jgi:hypothetical protein